MIKAENFQKKSQKFSQKNPKISRKIPKKPKNLPPSFVRQMGGGYFPKFFLRGVCFVYTPWPGQISTVAFQT